MIEDCHAARGCRAGASPGNIFRVSVEGGEVTKPGWRAFAATALMTSIGVLPASISTAHAQSPVAAKCNATGNISLDDRIAGCTVAIETATAMPQSVIFAHFRRAGFYLQKGDVDRAIADYDQIIEHDPNNPIARLRRASAYFQKREFDAALADYEKAVELDPKDEYAYLGRAGAYMAKEDIDRANADYGRVLLIHPDNFSAYVGRGLAYNAKDEPDRAIADCNRAIEISPEHGTGQFCRGHVYIAKGNTELALADFNQAIQFNPRDPRFYLGRASVFRARGDFEQALSNITQAIDLAPNNPYLYRWRGTAHFQAGLLPEALDDLGRSTELDQMDLYTQLWLDLVRQKSGQPSQLDEAAKQLDMSQWPAPVVRLFLGQTTFEAVLTEAADDANTVKMKGQVCEAYFYAGELALGRGATEQAMRQLHLAVDVCPRRHLEWPAASAELHRLDTKP
jgi:tetratricopeptide (TPR) repeat protein